MEDLRLSWKAAFRIAVAVVVVQAIVAFGIAITFWLGVGVILRSMFTGT